MLFVVIKKVVSRIADIFGFTISRHLSERSLKSRNDGHPIYIEFVGISGVGKTTLFNVLNENTKRNWVYSKEFVQSLSTFDRQKQFKLPEFYQDLIRHKTNLVLNKSFSPYDTLHLFNYDYSVIWCDALLNLFNSGYTIICDDGLIHNYSESVKYLFYKDKYKFKSLVSGRAIIYCYTSPQIAAERVLKRKNESGELRPQHKKANSYDSLVDIQTKALRAKGDLISILEKYIPVLRINNECDCLSNIGRINSFICKLKSG